MTLLDVKNQIEDAQEIHHGDSWPAPDLTILVAGRRKPPELPLEVFGDIWGQWIAGHAENRSVPADYVAGGLLASASELIGNARWASPWQGWSEPPDSGCPKAARSGLPSLPNMEPILTTWRATN